MKKVSIVLSVFLIALHFGCRKDDGPEVLDPEITISNFETSVEENPVENQVLGTVSASTNTGTLVFSLTGQTPSGALSINASSGQLTVADPSVFVFETNPTITATVQAKVEDVAKTANITINVTEGTLKVATAVIDKTGYTAPEDLTFLYSTDGGDSYSTDKPTDLTEGDEILVNISNGIMDISKDDFSFTWINSSPVPQTSDIALAKFVVGSTDLDIKVAVVDKWELVTSNLGGEFSVINLDDFTLSSGFAVISNDQNKTIGNVGGVVYNPNNHKIYISTGKNGEIFPSIYEVNTPGMVANSIYENDGTWSKIPSLILAQDNTLVASIDFGDFENHALVYSSLTGDISEPAFLSGDLLPNSGMGITWSEDGILVGDGYQSSILIHKSSITGVISESIALDLQGFENVNPASYTIRDLEWVGAKLYAICLETISGDTYLAEVDLDNKKFINKMLVSPGGQGRYENLALIPAYLF